MSYILLQKGKGARAPLSLYSNTLYEHKAGALSEAHIIAAVKPEMEFYLAELTTRVVAEVKVNVTELK